MPLVIPKSGKVRVVRFAAMYAFLLLAGNMLFGSSAVSILRVDSLTKMFPGDHELYLRDRRAAMVYRTERSRQPVDSCAPER
jgi:hypothetical protein